MSKKSIVKKESRKDDLDPSKDEFVVKSMSFLDWAVERRKQIGALLGIILLAWVGAIVFSNMQENRLQEASSMLSEGLEASLAPIAAPEDGMTSNEDILTFATRDARSAEAAKRLEKAASDTVGTPVSAMAKFAQASVLNEKGEYAKAVELYRECLADDSLAFMTDSVRIALATALEAAGKTDEAASEYETLASAQGRIGLWARYGQARILHKGGDAATAETMLKAIVDEIAPESPDRSDYLFAQARARLISINPQAEVPEASLGLNPQLLQQFIQQQQGAGGAL